MKNLILVLLALVLVGCSVAPATPAVQTWDSVDYSEASPLPSATPLAKAVHLSEYTWYTSPDNLVLYVDGIVWSSSDVTVRIVRVSAQARDADGKLLAVGTTDIAKTNLEPHGQSVFKIVIPNRPGVKVVSITSISWQ